MSKIILENLDVNVAMTTSDKDICDILDDEIKKLLPWSKRWYCAKVKIRVHLSEQYSIQNIARGKIMNRYIAENSSRSAFSFAITVISTHFILGKSLSNNICKKLPKEAQETIDLVSKLNNNVPYMSINPKLIFSTDDTTMCVYEGIEEKSVSREL